MHICAYICILHVYLCLSRPVLHATTFQNFISNLQQLFRLCRERSPPPPLLNLHKCSQNCPYERNYDAQINCSHLSAHQHLVHIEVGDQPKRIENQMCSTSLPSVFIVSGIRAWVIKGPVFANLYHRPAARPHRVHKNT